MDGERFLVCRQDKGDAHISDTFTLTEVVDRLVNKLGLFADAAILRQSFLDDELVNTPFAYYWALNGQHDPRIGPR